MSCSIEGCDKPHYARSWCRGHYRRWAKYGELWPDEPLGRYTPEANARMAEKLRGRTHGPMSDEVRRNISAAKRGRSNGLEGTTRSAETRAKIGEANHGQRNAMWKGDDVGYIALHERVRKALPRVCLHCGATEHLQAALRHDATGPIKTDTMRVAGKERTVRYSTNVDDYIRLCVSCHRSYDFQTD